MSEDADRGRRDRDDLLRDLGDVVGQNGHRDDDLDPRLENRICVVPVVACPVGPSSPMRLLLQVFPLRHEPSLQVFVLPPLLQGLDWLGHQR